jgi:hypothetical protein
VSSPGRQAAKHAVWVHEGTGLYGPPPAHLIYPRHARFLHFFTYDGVEHFVPFIRGQRPQPFLTDALEACFDGRHIVYVRPHTRSAPGGWLSGKTVSVPGYVRRASR